MNNYYSIFENVIKNGGYDLSNLLVKMDTYHIEGKLNDEERENLRELARTGAEYSNSTDIFQKVEEIDKRVKALENGEYVPDDNDYPDYVAGKWYYNGDKITFNGERYVCVAPNGAVCTWSPDEYPAYWEAV